MSNRPSISLPAETNIPNHLVIMPDGDRRWARSNGLTPQEGHKAGIKNMVKLAKSARDWGIHTVSVWGLSTENWQERPKSEIDFLMKWIANTIECYLKDMKKDGVRFVHLGRKDRLPRFLLEKIAKAERETMDNAKHIFNVGLDYNGWDEMVRATQRIVDKGIPADKIDRKTLDQHMDTAGQPYPYIDLYIRTSGEQRTSGFMMWQADYAEFYWEQDHFPDFTPEKLKEAVLDYSRRRRRFGGNDQLDHFVFKPEVVAKLELAWWRLRKIPEGTRFRDYAFKHLSEQFGLSKKLAFQAAKYLLTAVHEENNGRNWNKALASLKKFYKLIKEEIKLTFEPSLVASLELKLIKETAGKSDISMVSDAEETARELYAEVYRISLFQTAKLAHLRVLAAVERNLAEAGLGEQHWDKAQDYLEKFYRALKERVA